MTTYSQEPCEFIYKVSSLEKVVDGDTIDLDYGPASAFHLITKLIPEEAESLSFIGNNDDVSLIQSADYFTKLLISKAGDDSYFFNAAIVWEPVDKGLSCFTVETNSPIGHDQGVVPFLHDDRSIGRHARP